MGMTPGEKKAWNKGFEAGENSVEEGLPGWFGTFADMMTLLFAFFVCEQVRSEFFTKSLLNLHGTLCKLALHQRCYLAAHHMLQRDHQGSACGQPDHQDDGPE